MLPEVLVRVRVRVRFFFFVEYYYYYYYYYYYCYYKHKHTGVLGRVLHEVLVRARVCDAAVSQHMHLQVRALLRLY